MKNQKMEATIIVQLNSLFDEGVRLSGKGLTASDICALKDYYIKNALHQIAEQEEMEE